MARFEFRKSSATHTHRWKGKHRFEHWYRDNTMYFITARVRDKYPAFDSEKAKQVFWNRMLFYAEKYSIIPCIVTLLHNHYHIIAYVRNGQNVASFMQRLHGSVAKLTNDLLPERHLPFWRTAGNRDYYDGCLRDEDQLRRAYRYTLKQAVCARLVKRWEDYPHTRVFVELKQTIDRAKKRRAIPIPVPYARYDTPK